MAIQCQFIDLIIPIENINKVYPGGFSEFKENSLALFSRKFWNDQFLIIYGATNPPDTEFLAKKLEQLGLIGIIEKDGQKQWKDFCVVEGMFGGLTLKCDWIEYDSAENCVYMKGKPKGEIVDSSLI
jgi:hypothetical protein